MQEPKNQSRPRGIVVVAILMMVFGLAEVMTGVTHNFFGIFASQVAISPYAGAAIAIGVLYAMAGLLILSLRRRAAAIAIAFLIIIFVGRIALVVTGLYPLDSFKQILAIILGSSIVALFAVYIGLKWSFFR